MSSDPDLGRSLTVTDGPVTVTKSFEGTEFPVPAVKFVLESTATEPTSVRLTDTIPESFPMESVGFHPDFEKDNWTAYKSHRVEYERTLEPGESTTTVYGVRLDGTDPATFLIEPSLSFPDADAGDDAGALDDVLGEDSNQIVRDVLSGERDALPGAGDGSDGVEEPTLAAEAGFEDGETDGPDPNLDLDPEPDTASEFAAPAADESSVEDLELDLDGADAAPDGADADSTAGPSPVALNASAESAVGRPETAAVTAVGADAPDEADGVDETDEAEEAGEDAVAGGVELDLADEDEVDEPARDGQKETGSATATTDQADESVTAAPEQPEGSVVAALADEVRRGDADEDDVAALRDALGAADGATEIPRSLDLRIGRLQTQLEDLAAYSEGLREFLDEEGTAEELIEEFRADVRSTEQSFESLSARVDEADDDRARLHDDLGGVRTEVSEVGDRVTAVEERFDEVTERFDAVTERFDEVDSRLDAVDDRLEQLDGMADWLDEVDGRAAAAEGTAERLDDEMSEVREDVAALDTDLTDTRESLETDLAEARESLDDDLAETREQVAADVAETREELGDDVAAVRDDVSTVRDDVADLENDLDSLGDTVEDFRAFRDRLSSALGTMGGAPVDTDDADANADAEGAADGDDAVDGDPDHDSDEADAADDGDHADGA